MELVTAVHVTFTTKGFKPSRLSLTQFLVFNKFMPNVQKVSRIRNWAPKWNYPSLPDPQHCGERTYSSQHLLPVMIFDSYGAGMSICITFMSYLYRYQPLSVGGAQERPAGPLWKKSIWESWAKGKIQAGSLMFLGKFLMNFLVTLTVQFLPSEFRSKLWSKLISTFDKIISRN
jgi:hypothetical protein